MRGFGAYLMGKVLQSSLSVLFVLLETWYTEEDCSS